jgi:FXSXX-COOH protein
VDGESPTGDAEPAWQSVMVDVSAMPLTDLPALTPADGDESVLAHCLRRLADDLTRPGEPIAGFNSAF